jgi:MinD-like ATPase involved in chromosome partitioning or flagellar assembly
MLRHGGQPVALFSTAAAELAGAAPGPDRITSLVDALVGNAEPDRITFDDWDGIAVLSIQSVDAKSNLFADFQNQRVRQIMDAACLKGGILLDLPPLSASADALALARYADAVVVVASVGLTTIDETAETIQRLRRAGSNVIGTVISQVGA